MLNTFKWLVRLVLGAMILAVMTNCTQLGLNYASVETDNKPLAWPPLEGERLTDLLRAPDGARSALETHVFGPFPVGLQTRLIDRRLVDPAYASGAGSLEELTLAIGDGRTERQFHLAVAFPAARNGPAPLIINQTFCSNRISFATNALSPMLAEVDMCGDDAEASGLAARMITAIFGRYIATPPNEEILRRGYAIASFFASDIVPDAAGPGRAVLSEFPLASAGRPSGAVAAWGAGYSAVLDVLESDPRVDAGRTSVMGFSRHAKSALVAGAYDTRIDAVVAHQAGTGGASLSRGKVGESVASITRSYPHWFDPAYAKFDAAGLNSTPTDMHMLIALNAGQPVLLGNGRRDVWSDPNATFRAAQAADAVWAAQGRSGLGQGGMQDLDLSAGLVFYLRGGGHGIVQRDWDTFLAFLDTAMPENPLPMARNHDRFEGSESRGEHR